MSKAISTFQVKITFTQNLSNLTHLTPYNLTIVASSSVKGLLNAQIFCSLKCIICVGFPFVFVFSFFAKKKKKKTFHGFRHLITLHIIKQHLYEMMLFQRSEKSLIQNQCIKL